MTSIKVTKEACIIHYLLMNITLSTSSSSGNTDCSADDCFPWSPLRCGEEASPGRSHCQHH